MNPSESVALQLRLDAGDPYHSHKMEALKAAGMGSTASFPLRLNAFPAGLLEVLAHSLASAFARRLLLAAASAENHAWCTGNAGQGAGVAWSLLASCRPPSAPLALLARFTITTPLCRALPCRALPS